MITAATVIGHVVPAEDVHPGMFITSALWKRAATGSKVLYIDVLTVVVIVWFSSFRLSHPLSSVSK